MKKLLFTVIVQLSHPHVCLIFIGHLYYFIPLFFFPPHFPWNISVCVNWFLRIHL